QLQPMLAQPGDPGGGVSVSELQEPVRIDIAYGGSCTDGKREDLRHCHDVLAWAVGHGLKVAAGTRYIVQFGSQDVRDWCVREGMFETFTRGRRTARAGLRGVRQRRPRSLLARRQGDRELHQPELSRTL